MKDGLTVAVDFDGTLCEDCFPKIGEVRTYELNLIKELQRKGAKIILWTCRRDERLQEAVDWSEEHGLKYDAVNANLPDNIERYGGDTRKVSADVYYDDKVLPSADSFVKIVKKINAFLMEGQNEI